MLGRPLRPRPVPGRAADCGADRRLTDYQAGSNGVAVGGSYRADRKGGGRNRGLGGGLRLTDNIRYDRQAERNYHVNG